MLQTVITTLCGGFLKTLEIFAVTLLGALPLGLIIAFGSMSRFIPLKAFIRTIVWIVRGTPLMLQLLIIYYGPGILFDSNIWGGGANGVGLSMMCYKNQKTSPKDKKEYK